MSPTNSYGIQTFGNPTLVEDLIARAVSDVPYYRTRYSASTVDLRDLAPLSRADLVAHEQALVSDAAERGSLLPSRSSGTTGQPAVVWQTPAERARAAFALWQARRWHGLTSTKARSARFYGHRRGIHDSASRYEPVLLQGALLQLNWFHLDDDTFRRYADALASHQPEWLQGSPAVLHEFAHFLSREGIQVPSSIKLVELIGELVIPSVRTEISRAFPTSSVADNYGTREIWGIAYDCPAQKKHVLDDNVIVELGDPIDRGALKTEGDLILTARHNRAMPLLRYQTGDRVTLSSEACDCGRRGPVIEHISGRSTEFALNDAGDKILPHFFYTVIAQANAEFGDPIVRYKVDAYGRQLVVSIETATPVPMVVKTRLAELVAFKFPNQPIDVVEGEIAIEGGRKYRHFTNHTNGAHLDPVIRERGQIG
jgi:phenylacetate-CoA ligase